MKDLNNQGIILEKNNIKIWRKIMKKLFIIIFVILLSVSIMAQENEVERFQLIIDRLVEAYNLKDYEGMGADYSEELLKELPAEKSKPMFEELMSTYGKIQKLDPPNIKDSQAVFKAYFEKDAILDIILVLNDEDRDLLDFCFVKHFLLSLFWKKIKLL